MVINWSKFVFKHCLSKHYKTGAPTHLLIKNCACKFNNYWLVQVVFWTPKLGPVNNPYLDQLITIKNSHSLFFAFKNVLTYLFYSVFWNIHQNLPKTCPPKKRQLFTFCKTQAQKKRCNPPLDQKLVFFNLCFFWNQKHWCWTKT